MVKILLLELNRILSSVNQNKLVQLEALTYSYIFMYYFQNIYIDFFNGQINFVFKLYYKNRDRICFDCFIKELFQYFDHHDRNLLAFFNRVSLDILGMNCRVSVVTGARCSSVVRAFAHGAMGRRIDPSWGEPLSYFSFQPVLQRVSFLTIRMVLNHMSDAI